MSYAIVLGAESLPRGSIESFLESTDLPRAYVSMHNATADEIVKLTQLLNPKLIIMTDSTMISIPPGLVEKVMLVNRDGDGIFVDEI